MALWETRDPGPLPGGVDRVTDRKKFSPMTLFLRGNHIWMGFGGIGVVETVWIGVYVDPWDRPPGRGTESQTLCPEEWTE